MLNVGKNFRKHVNSRDTTTFPSKPQAHNMAKHSQTIRQQQTTNCLSVFDHFVGLALKGLRDLNS